MGSTIRQHCCEWWPQSTHQVPRQVFCFCTGHYQHPEGSGCFRVSVQAMEAANHSQVCAETPLLSVLGNQASFWCAPSWICTGLLPSLNFLVCTQCSLLDAAIIDFIGPFTTLDCICDPFLIILGLLCGLCSFYSWQLSWVPSHTFASRT